MDTGRQITAAIAVFILFFANCCYGMSSHQRLLDYLMQNYPRVHIRPVHKTSTTTNVTFRPLLVNLIEMDTKNQQYTLFSWLKTVWTDEFLRWNASEYDGTKVIYLPHDSVWKPDITLEQSPYFQSFKPDTVVEVHNDGMIYWYVQAIYSGSCPVWVKWFPFDTQVCHMTFLSWAYPGTELDLEPDKSIDGTQRSYLENGVWDLVESSVKKVTAKYSCCPSPYYNLQFRLVFTRQATFYISYIVIPVILLSLLAVTVFFLPPDNSSKLQFSITNLLALSFYEKLIADVIPPASEHTPVIDIYFQIMIIMVSLSVFATVSVINLSSRSREPVPRWMQRLAFDILPTLLFMREYVKLAQDSNHGDSQSTANGKHTADTDGLKHSQINPAFISDMGMGYKDDCHSNGIPEPSINKTTKDNTKQFAEEWYLVGQVISRFFAVLFCAIVILSTGIILFYIWHKSNIEFDNAVGTMKDEWLSKTYFTDKELIETE